MTRTMSRFSKMVLRSAYNRFDLFSEKGFTYAFMVIILPVLLGFMALVIEIGMVLEVRRDLQAAADAGALAGAQLLPDSPDTAITVAEEYVAGNGNLTYVTPSVSTTYYEDDTITVTTVRNVPLALMPILGYDSAQEVRATASAIVGTLGVGECVMPLGIVDANGQGTGGDWVQNGFGYSFGVSVTLKVGVTDSSYGNFQALNIYGTGGSGYRDGLSGDCSEVSIAVGDVFNTETGNMVGPTKQGIQDRLGYPDSVDTHQFSDVVTQTFDTSTGVTTTVILDPDCPRIGIVPIVDTYDGITGSKPITIVGFTYFYIDPITDYDPPGKQKAPLDDGLIIGRFIDSLVPGVFTGYNPTGTRVVRLMR